MIKTINLTGSEVKVTELGGDNTEIFNNSNGIVYASKLPNITVGGDEVIAIPVGAIDGLYGTRGTVYLLGSGSVELRGVDHKITESRGQYSGDSLGVFADYVDAKSAETLDIAKTYTDIKDSEVIVGVKEYADSLNAELAGYIGYTDNDIYGLEADFENCVFTRLAGAVGKKAGADFDSVNAYGGRRRCNLSDDGEVLAYYGDENFQADGSNGQVMVEQPKFYYRVVPLKTEKINGVDGYHLRKARYYISDTPKVGFKVHPAFVHNGAEVDRIYLSAFEGCIYDTSAETYLLEDEQVADFDNDKLSSIAWAKPCSGQSQILTRANIRKLASKRGNGWTQSTIKTISVTQLLFIIEYASFNSQETIGNGAVSNSKNIDENLAEKTGSTLSLANMSGNIVNENGVQIVSYRGEENFWGNIWTWVDGINVQNPNSSANCQYGKIYIYDDGVADESNASYKQADIFPAFASGYISAFGYSHEFDWLFIPTECAANSRQPIGDCFWNEGTTSNGAILGGYWVGETRNGMFYLGLYVQITARHRGFGARLAFIP